MDEPTPSKACTRCGVAKPLDEFYAKPKAADGRVSRCKQCQREVSRDWRLKNLERSAATVLPADYAKPCSRCSEILPASNYYPCGTAYDGLTPDCSPCIRKRRREYAAANREKESTARAAWVQANAEHYREYMAQWRAANTERIRLAARQWAERNPERYAELRSQWYLANREAILERNHTDPDRIAARREAARRSAERNRDARTEAQRRRRVDKLGLRIEDVDLDALWTGSCALCGEPIDRDLRWPDPMSKSIDHTVPLSRGGTHEAHNLSWTHLFCNVSKGARLPD